MKPVLLRVLVVLVCVVATAALVGLSLRNATASTALSAQELADGWLLLFDGETLFGWEPASKANWRAEQGVLSASEGEEGLLCTTSDFGDYVLALEFRAAPGGNSGVFVRTPPTPDDVAESAYEVNIAPSDNPFPTGSLVKRQLAAAVPDSSDWQSMEITTQGPQIKVKLGGRQILDYTDPKPVHRGRIGLQFRTGKIEFRNVKLRPLGAKSMFNGKDLGGWKTYPEMPSVFSVTPEGWLNVKNGPGQLESEGQYGDFTMQAEVFVNGDKLNSGIFYRSIPGDKMNGYESQICNSYDDGGKCGTGGIFRRSAARKIVARDREWFTQTIHAVGNHVAVWVNGYQVADWTDDRPPNANPRKGLRLEPGTIIIQGHDPTTDFSFRNLRIAEVLPR